MAGRSDAAVKNATDSATGLPIYSLYGETRRPTDEMLKDLDAIVFDIQEAGVRFYTYVTTMAYWMEEAAKHAYRVLRARPAESDWRGSDRRADARPRPDCRLSDIFRCLRGMR